MFNKISFSIFVLIFISFSNIHPQSKGKSSGTPEVKPKITFVELGSVNCIPCKKMQPVMKAIADKYGYQIKVIFYDVWKPEQEQYGEKYGIRIIPTQVFLDENGKEIFRHEGFFPEKEIDKILQSKGLTILAKN